MKKVICAGTFMLAMLIGFVANSPAKAGEVGTAAIDVGRIHRVLQLTQEQERYWHPVEAALRAISRHQEANESEGLVHRVSHRLVQIVLDSAAVERLAVAARPLIARLSDQQKQAAGQLAQEMGLGPVVMAALN
jgi:hypothetical protein